MAKSRCHLYTLDPNLGIIYRLGAKSRCHLYTLDPNLGIICILGARGSRGDGTRGTGVFTNIESLRDLTIILWVVVNIMVWSLLGPYYNKAPSI